MADNSIANDLLSSLGGAIAAQANKPQKTSSTTTSTPLQLADMIARRNSIGNASANLAESLKQREGFGYNLANSIAGLPGAQQEGTGAGLLNFAKAFGGAYNSRINSAIDNAQKQYDASRTDLSDALNYDKEMGNQQTEDIGYAGNVSGKAASLSQLPSSANWTGMAAFDASRPTPEDYRKQTQLGRKLENATTFTGDENEAAARAEFERAKLSKLSDARQRLKGSGTITDFEDKKYSKDIESIKDPVALYDYTFNWAKNLNAVANGQVPLEDILFNMGITPDVINIYGIPKASR